jgi:hypothetical protein
MSNELVSNSKSLHCINIHRGKLRPVPEGSPITRSKSLQWPRIVLLTAAMVAVLFVASGASFLHQDAPGTICSICYAAHLPALRSAPVRTPVISSAVAWLVTADLRLDHAAPESLQSPPRGPPSA